MADQTGPMPEPPTTTASYVCKKCGWSGEVTKRNRCKACDRQASKKWRSENPDRVKSQHSRFWKKFRKERPEEYLAQRRKYYKPENGKKARQQRLGWFSSGDLTVQELREIYRSSSGKCSYCGTQVSRPRFSRTNLRGFDHVVPLIKGGKHTASNIVVCCRTCNTNKNDKLEYQKAEAAL